MLSDRLSYSMWTTDRISFIHSKVSEIKVNILLLMILKIDKFMAHSRERWAMWLFLHSHAIKLFEWICRKFDVNNFSDISTLGNWTVQVSTKDGQCIPSCSHLLPPSQGLTRGGKISGGCPFLQSGKELGCWIQTWQTEMIAVHFLRRCWLALCNYPKEKYRKSY